MAKDGRNNSTAVGGTRRTGEEGNKERAKRESGSGNGGDPGKESGMGQGYSRVESPCVSERNFGR